MFSQLFSFIKKKKEKIENNRRKNSNVSLAKEALEVVEDCTTRSNSCVTSEAANSPSTSRRITNLTLLQGSSESKPATEQRPTSQRTERSRTATRSPIKLYPRLDVLVSRESDKPVVVVKKRESKKLKSIHDMAEEISCVIDPRILDAEKSRKRLRLRKTLKDIMSQTISAILSLNANSSIFDYEFKRELEVKENSSENIIASDHYKKITSFHQLKIHHESIEGKAKTASRKNRNKDPIKKTSLVFKSFSKSLKCYRGKANDLVDCP